MSDDADDASDEAEHGIDFASYSGGYGEPYYQPMLACLCGWSSRRQTWEEAGAEFDEHLEENDG